MAWIIGDYTVNCPTNGTTKRLVKNLLMSEIMAVKGRPKADLHALDSPKSSRFYQRRPVKILFHNPP